VSMCWARDGRKKRVILPNLILDEACRYFISISLPTFVCFFGLLAAIWLSPFVTSEKCSVSFVNNEIYFDVLFWLPLVGQQ
jgi:hypothetical protein